MSAMETIDCNKVHSREAVVDPNINSAPEGMLMLRAYGMPEGTLIRISLAIGVEPYPDLDLGGCGRRGWAPREPQWVARNGPPIRDCHQHLTKKQHPGGPKL